MTQQSEGVFDAPNEQALLAIAEGLSRCQVEGLTLYLQGELGMGKTTFSRGVINGFGHRGAVKSPTYTLVEPYEFGAIIVYHFDLYRLGDPEELEYMGIRDYFSDNSLCLIEWPQRGAGILKGPDIVVHFSVQGQGRRLHWQAMNALGRAVAQQWCDALVKAE